MLDLPMQTVEPHGVRPCRFNDVTECGQTDLKINHVTSPRSIIMKVIPDVSILSDLAVLCSDLDLVSAMGNRIP
jgi:hypothetical protein